MIRVVLASLALSALTACAREAEPTEEVSTAEVTISTETAGSERVGPIRTPTTNVTIEGVAGGPVEASSMHPDCVGWLPSEPQYVLEIGSPEDLSLTATIQGDAVLLVVMPDGTVRCDDDSVGFNPRVTGYFAPGRYPVFVGTWARAAVGTPFELVIGSPVFPEGLRLGALWCGGPPQARGERSKTDPLAGPVLFYVTVISEGQSKTLTSMSSKASSSWPASSNRRVSISRSSES